jgi:hypothetical protein
MNRLENSRHFFQFFCCLLFAFCFAQVKANELEAELFGEGSFSPAEGSNFAEGSANTSLNSEEEALFSESSSSEEDALFGEQEGSDSPASHSFKELLNSKLQESDDQFFIGGKYYHALSFTGTDNQSARETGFSSDGIADIYFDATLDDGVRFFLKQKIQQDFSGAADDSNVVDFSGPEASTSIDQMWLKFNYRNSLYMTMGKQPTSWGAGFVWAPTDFINAETASPFSLSDQRLGVSLVKFQYPLDHKGMNVYGVFQTNEASTVGGIKSLVRAEKVFEQSELAISVSSQPYGELKGGLDYSSGLKWFDVYFNVGATKNDQGLYYQRPEGSEDLSSDDMLGLLQAGVDADPDAIPENAQLEIVDRSDEILKQVSTGLIYLNSFDDGSQVIVNSEFFYNEKGYDNDEILTLLLLQNPAAFDPLHFSKRYFAFGVTRAGLGDSSQSYGLQYIRSLSDTSGAVIGSFGFNPFQDLSFSSSLIVFTGGAGTFNPFTADTEALEETADRVGEGELDTTNIEDNAGALPPVLESQDTNPVTATVGDTSFEAPRYIIRTQFSLKF